MGVFISWSDENSPSHELAKALDEWIPSVVQHVDCYLSSKDTVAGTLWTEKIMKELGGNNVGIVCLYAGNLSNPWIHFEAGAIAVKIGQTRLCPLLIGLKKTGVPPPLGMFQVKTLDKEEMFSVMEMINTDGGEKKLPTDKLRASFEVWWGKLEQRIQEIEALRLSTTTPIQRSDREILEEILENVRSSYLTQSRALASSKADLGLFEKFEAMVENLKAGPSTSLTDLQKRAKARALKDLLTAGVQKIDPVLAQALSAGSASFDDDGTLTIDFGSKIPEADFQRAQKIATALGISLKLVLRPLATDSGES